MRPTEARSGVAGPGQVRLGGTWQASAGHVKGAAALVAAVIFYKAWQGKARSGLVGLGAVRRGLTRRGKARLG